MNVPVKAMQDMLNRADNSAVVKANDPFMVAVGEALVNEKMAVKEDENTFRLTEQGKAFTTLV